jgi:uncharacterized integral membrane protein
MRRLADLIKTVALVGARRPFAALAIGFLLMAVAGCCSRG